MPAPPAQPSVLLIEDDRELCRMLSGLLQQEGYAVRVANDGQSGLGLALTGSYDVVVIDRGLPFIDGLELLTRLRRRGWSQPVLILSAYGTPADRVAGLDAGAEDYLNKPFDVEELLARLRALRRRHRDVAALLPVVGGLLDVAARLVYLDDGSDILTLSSREAELLGVLARRPRWVFTRDDLRDLVFQDSAADSIIDTYVHYLRRKLGRSVIRTVHGVGYQAGTSANGRGP